MREWARLGSCVLFAASAAIWLLSFVPGTPAEGFWGAVVFSSLIAVFPIWFLVIGEARRDPRQQGMARPRRGVALPLEGWRKTASIVLGLVFLASFASLFLSFAANENMGQPQRRGDLYFTTDHGEVTQVTHEEYLHAHAATSRLFSAGMMVFTGTAALYLTQPRADPQERRARPGG